MITFNDIPQSLRIPGIYAEFDPSRANNANVVQKILVLGQRLSTGSVAEGQPMAVTSVAQAEAFWGRGSMIAHMVGYMMRARPSMAVWGIALDDDGAGVAATGDITFTGAADTSGTLVITVAGESVRVAVADGDTQDSIASAVVAAINAQTDFPVTAAVDGVNTNEVDLTARHAGEYANDFITKVQFEAAVQPSAPAIAITQMAGGSGNPDVANAIAAMGDEWYNWIVMPWNDAANLTALETELTDRYLPTRQLGARAFTAFRGTYGESQAFGDGRNSPHVTCMGTGPAPQPPYIWAAVNAVVAANSLANDPSQQLTSLHLPNILPPEPDERFTFSERNLLLFDGIATFTVDARGRVQIESQISMYQENAQGVADDSMLYINVPETFDRYRFEVIKLFAPHARDKLRDDGGRLPTGQPIMTPKKGKGMMISFYRRCVEELGWCEDVESYIESLIVEKQANRLAIVDQPDFIDNLRQVYMRSELVS